LLSRPTTKKVDSVDIFELEAEQAYDNSFAVFCFFEDLHRIQDSLTKLWKDCAAGQTSVVAATAVTEAAVLTIRRAEQEICANFLPNQSDNDCYEVLAKLVVTTDTVNKGLNPVEKGGVDIPPFDNFIFLPVARTLRKFIKIAAMNNKYEVQWLAPIPPLSFNHISQPDKADAPKHKKLQEDGVFLSQMLLDLQHLDKCRSHSSVLPPGMPVTALNSAQDDNLTTTLRLVRIKGKMGVSTVVAAQVLLDIQEACQSKLPILHRQLMYAHKHASDSFGFKLRVDGGMTTEGLNWPNSGVHTIQGTFELLKKIEIPMFPIMKGFMLQSVAPPKLYTYENAPSEMKASWGERPPPEMEAAMERTMIDFIRPAPADNFAYVHNPLHSGSVILKLLLDNQKAGLALANWHLSIFVVAHLYNAMRQLNLLKEQWGVMDRIIRLHKKKFLLMKYQRRQLISSIAWRLG
jgi:hypothetical protein